MTTTYEDWGAQKDLLDAVNALCQLKHMIWATALNPVIWFQVNVKYFFAIDSELGHCLDDYVSSQEWTPLYPYVKTWN